MQPAVILLHLWQCIMVDDDIHDQLTKAYMEYFKENDKFEARNSVRTHTASRKCLREIRRLAKLRMEEIREKHVTTRKTKTKGKTKQVHIYTGCSGLIMEKR